MSKTAKTYVCETCGKTFVAFPDRMKAPVKRCRDCQRAWREERRRERERAAGLERQEQKKEEKAAFEEEVAAYNPIDMAEISPSKNTLYIIGNGFDQMHRVKSSYYGFRDSLGKNNELRATLERYLTPDDIWADFEESLAKLDLDSMGSRTVVDTMLDISGFYSDEDAGAAEYYMAIEEAASPAATIASKLQPSFRRWVEKLAVGTADRPLKDLFRPGGKVLCFNYTEFVEDLYQMYDVCYIHGCRKKEGEKLVLGHRPGAACDDLSEKRKEPRTYRQAVIDTAQDKVLSIIANCDVEFTKDSQGIIEGHRAFFEGLKGIDQIVVVGHSASPVDWDYFREVHDASPGAHWFFGSYGLRDLRNMRALAEAIGLRDIDVFRTDGISTNPSPGAAEDEPPAPKPPKPRVFRSGSLKATADGLHLEIAQGGIILLDIGLPYAIRKAVFAGEHLLVVLGDWESSVLLFGNNAGRWALTGLLVPTQNQGLMNRRLRHIYATDHDITFVYNNRISSYDLASGRLIMNKQIRGAKSMEYEGVDVFPELACALDS